MATTTTRDRRIEARADAATLEIIRQAAQLSNATVSTFVVEAAREKAETLVAQADRTFMPAEQFDAMIDALDSRERVPELTRLFSGPNRIVRE